MFEAVRERGGERDIERDRRLVGTEERGGPKEANESIGNSMALLLRK